MSSTTPITATPSATVSLDADQSTNTTPVSQQPNQQYVDHTYTNYANVDEDDLRLLKESGDGKGAPSQTKLLSVMSSSYGPMKNKCSAIMPFPGKLLEVLDRGDLTSIIDWMDHGRAFIVKQPKIFTTQVLPRFFKQTKFLSFTRQLNLWGFKRITRGLDAGAYYHELFLPGRPNLSMRMRRQKIKGTGIRPIPNPEQEPNFYYQYPQVPRVPRSGAPIPLPLLPSERMANLMNGVDPQASVRQAQMSQPVSRQSFNQSSYVPQMAPSASAGLGRNPYSAGLPGLGIQQNGPAFSYPTRTAAAAEARLEDLLRSGLTSGSSLPRSLPKSSMLDFELAMNPRSKLSAPAPRSFNPLNDVEDEVSNANRRLMERLLSQVPSAPTPAAMPQNTTSSSPDRAHRQSFKASLLKRASGQALIGRTSLASSSSSSTQALSAVQHESFQLPNPPQALNSSLFSTQDYSSFMRQGAQSLSNVPLTLPAGAQDVNVHTVTNALREARQLEDLARNQRATAQALADALQQRVGRDVQDLFLLGREFKDQR